MWKAGFVARCTATLSHAVSCRYVVGTAEVLPELIEPGKPQQSGRHERMHRTLKAETTRPPAASCQAQHKPAEHPGSRGSSSGRQTRAGRLRHRPTSGASLTHFSDDESRWLPTSILRHRHAASFVRNSRSEPPSHNAPVASFTLVTLCDSLARKLLYTRQPSSLWRIPTNRGCNAERKHATPDVERA